MPTIDALLKKYQRQLSQIGKVEVVVEGASFTALRIGIVVANALAYALEVPVSALSQDGRALASARKKFGRYSLAVPHYTRQPDIGRPKPAVSFAGNRHVH